jgi:glycosyltransferase involved in cell wall biosynthesis
VESLDLLVREAPLRAALGEKGRRYIEAEYRWPVVMERYRSLIRTVSATDWRRIEQARPGRA